MRTAADLAAVVERVGGIVILSIEEVPVSGGGTRIAARMAFEDPWAAARLLVELADEDASDPVVRAWALDILRATAEAIGESLGPTLSPALSDAFARAIHDNVQAQIKFIQEPLETFQSAAVTMQSGAGDCDDHARLVYALACAGGLNSQLVFFEDEDSGSLPMVMLGGDGTQPVHVVAQIQDPNGAWQWAETTIAAEYGEEPHDAFERLGGVPATADPFRGAAAGGAAGVGFLGLDFVTPADVQTRKTELDATVNALDGDVIRCQAIDSATLSAWNEFVVSWREFYAVAPSVWNAGGQGRQAQEYADAIRDWQTRVSTVCTLSGPTLPEVKSENVFGTVAAVAVAVTAVAAAWTIAPVVRAAVR